MGCTQCLAKMTSNSNFGTVGVGGPSSRRTDRQWMTLMICVAVLIMSSAQCNDIDDCDLLVMPLGGSNTTDCCTLSWVSCTPERRVRAVVNPGLDVPIQLPPSWGFLTELVSINLEGASCSGTLPATWGNLAALQTVAVPRCGVTGSLPPEWGLLGRLASLDLSGNDLSGGLPSEWQSMESLTVAHLRSNRLTGGLPSSWNNMRRCEVLDLGFNRYLNGTLPLEWSFLTRLRELRVDQCGMSGTLPRGWGKNLTALTRLHLGGNAFVGALPPEWSAMSNLTSFDLGGNLLTGTLPAEWGATLRALVFLNVSFNLLNGPLPKMFGNMPQLATLLCDANRITGILPREWSALSNLQTLSLGVNQVTGVLPGEWSRLGNLSNLRLHDNAIGGSLPAEWNAMRALERIQVQRNSISGTLPPSWGLLPVLKSLDLSSNGLLGTLPAEWGGMPQNVSLAISDNQLEGTLCKEWGATLGNIVLSYNRFLSGTLPLAYVVNLSSFECIGCVGVGGPLPRFTVWDAPPGKPKGVLSLFASGIEGPIPGEYKDAKLDTLILQGTHVNGSVPSMFKYLRVLHVSGTRVSGSVRVISDSLQELFMDDTGITEIATGEHESFAPALRKLSFSRCQVLASFPSNLSASFPRLAAISAQSLPVAVSLAFLSQLNATVVDLANNTVMSEVGAAGGSFDWLHSDVAYVSLLPQKLSNDATALPFSLRGLTLLNAHEALQRVSTCQCCHKDAAVLVTPMASTTLIGSDFVYVSVVIGNGFYDFLGIEPLGDLTVYLYVTSDDIPSECSIPSPTWNGSVTSIPPLPSYRYQWTKLRDATLLRGVEYELTFVVTLFGVSVPEQCPQATYKYNHTRKLIAVPCEERSLAAVPFSTECVACPKNALCDGSTMLQSNGAAWRPASYVLPFYECNSAETLGCTGGDGTGCLEGYSGVLCSVCSDGYGKSGSSCVSCDTSTNSAVIVSLVCAAAVAAVTYVSIESTSLDATESSKKTEKSSARLVDVVKNILSRGLAVVKLVVNLASMATTVMFTASASLLAPIAVATLDTQKQIVAPAVGNSPLVSCALPSMTPRDLLVGLLISVPSLIVLESIVAWLWHRRASTVGVTTCLLQLSYEYVVQVSVTLLQGDDMTFYSSRDYLLKQFDVPVLTVSTLVADRRLDVNGWHRPVAWTVLIIFGVGVPVTLLAVVGSLRVGKGSRWVTSRFRFIVEDYRSERWYWEMIVMVRKLLSVVLVVPLWRYPVAQLQCISLLMMAYAIAHGCMAPNLSPHFYVAEQVACIGTIVCSTAMTFALSVGEATLAGDGVTSVILITQIVSLLCCLFAAASELRRETTVASGHCALPTPEFDISELVAFEQGLISPSQENIRQELSDEVYEGQSRAGYKAPV